MGTLLLGLLRQPEILLDRVKREGGERGDSRRLGLRHKGWGIRAITKCILLKGFSKVAILLMYSND
jgi:hypothetical protein